MYVAKVKVEQSSCSLAVATESGKFSMDLLEYIILNSKDVLFLVKITKCDGDISECLKVIEKHPSTLFLQILEKTNTHLDFLAVIRDTSGIKAFEESYCFIKPPIVVENGSKIYTILVPDLSYLAKAYEKLKKVGNWKVLQVTRISERKSLLTNAQKRAINVAWDLGYFSEKRTATIDEISRALGIAKTTAHKHLRAAVSKIVKKYMEDSKKEREIIDLLNNL
ncbi:MAG: helix-turn-helix domain-containing protein [Archaeoglobaceae archaeon]